MRRLALLVLFAACGKPAPRPIDMVTVATNAPDAPGAPDASVARTPAAPVVWNEGPGTFPLPRDADAGVFMNDATTYHVPRPRDEIHTQLLAKLAADGYAVDDEQFVMGGFRMTIHRTGDGAKFFVSVTEDEETTTLMSITVK